MNLNEIFQKSPHFFRVSVRITRPENNEVLVEAHGREKEEPTVKSNMPGETEITGNLLVKGDTFQRVLEQSGGNKKGIHG